MSTRNGLPWLGGGVLTAVLGAIWMLQGVGVLGGSVMSGHSQWVPIGVVVAVIGLALCAYGVRIGRGPRTP